MSALLQVKPWKLLLAILAAATFFRLWGIAFGLPYDGITYDALTIEEIQEIHRALKLGVGEYSTVFGKGGLYLVLFVEYGVYYVVLRFLGWVHGSREFALHVLQDRTTLYVLGRVTVAIMGIATCYVAYRVARRLYDERVALATALIGGLAYFHAMYSAVVNVDIGSTLAVWLSILTYLRYEETGRTRLLAGAGALVAVAIAFKAPGGIALLLVWAALVTAPKGVTTSGLVRKCGIVLIAMIATLTLIAPEWLINVGAVVRNNFAFLIQTAYAATDNSELKEDIKYLTTFRDGWKTGYLRHLFSSYNIALTVIAVYAAILGVARKNRWDTILAATIILYIGGMSLSNRTQPERYLLQIVPALWILGGRGAMELARYNAKLPCIALAAIVAMPTFWLARASVEKSRPDTRVLAKGWIESNIPGGTRVLMDGMRYRYSESPPINPDTSTVREKVDKAKAEGGNFGRGVSDYALSIYEDAMNSASGPRYEIISTVHGLEVKDIEYYAANCFGYIITTSTVAGRYKEGALGSRLFPESAAFYASLKNDPRVRLVHEQAPSPWHTSGPTIQVYRIENSCSPP